jgi:prolyl 4-hydroxylase
MLKECVYFDCRHNDHCMDNLEHFKTSDKACTEFLHRAGGPECGPGAGGPTCGDRVATFITYLKSPTRGGKTVFPQAKATHDAVPSEQQTGEEWYCEEESTLGAAPNPGDGVMFWNYRPGHGSGVGSYENGTADPAALPVYESLHSGCPVLEGEKWIVTRWIRGSGFDYTGP